MEKSIKFQSTLPIMAATVKVEGSEPTQRISIHVAHKDSDDDMEAMEPVQIISTHAAHKGSDYCPYALSHHIAHFNPRRP